MKHKVPQIDKITLYYAYIYSRIQYGIEVYGKASSTTMKAVQTQQNRALKILCNRDFCTPTLSRHKDLNILLVYTNNKTICYQTYSIISTQKMKIYTATKQDREKVHVNKITKTFGQDTMKHVGTTFWNQIPSTFTQFKTVQGFSKIVKQHILSFY